MSYGLHFKFGFLLKNEEIAWFVGWVRLDVKAKFEVPVFYCCKGTPYSWGADDNWPLCFVYSASKVIYVLCFIFRRCFQWWHACSVSVRSSSFLATGLHFWRSVCSNSGIVTRRQLALLWNLFTDFFGIWCFLLSFVEPYQHMKVTLTKSIVVSVSYIGIIYLS